MHVLITGGAGFIGSHLAEKLLDAGHSVHVMDDLSTGSIHNIDHLKARSGFGFCLETIFNEPLLREAVDRADVVYHLAAAVGVQLIVERPTHTIKTNVHGTELVLKYASLKSKWVFIASSSEVYGKNPNIPFTEESDLLLGPTVKHRWAYACSKALDEFSGLAHHREKRLPVTILRFFNTVGPRQTGRYGMVIPRFVSAALKHEPVPIYGDGTQSRSFTDVDDVTRVLVDLLSHQAAADGQVFNIGNPEEVSINELARRVISLTGSRGGVKYISYDQALGEGFEDMQRRVPSIAKISALTGFKPRHDLDDILKRVIAYFRKEAQ